MKINLEPPFLKDWSTGYLVVNTENRRMICLYNSQVDRTTISYARYLMSVHLNRYLNDDEHVDHIDEDKTNDNIDNLQILSPKANHNKSLKVGETYLDFVCPVCKIDFKLSKRQSHKNNPCCSRKCGGIKSHWAKTLRRNHD